MREWRAVSTWPVILPRSIPDVVVRCQGRRCPLPENVIPEGEPCTLIVDARLALSDPWNPETRRYACASCADVATRGAPHATARVFCTADQARVASTGSESQW